VALGLTRAFSSRRDVRRVWDMAWRWVARSCASWSSEAVGGGGGDVLGVVVSFSFWKRNSLAIPD